MSRRALKYCPRLVLLTLLIWGTTSSFTYDPDDVEIVEGLILAVDENSFTIQQGDMAVCWNTDVKVSGLHAGQTARVYFSGNDDGTIHIVTISH